MDKEMEVDDLLELKIESEEAYTRRNPSMFIVRSHVAGQINKFGCSMKYETIDRLNYMVARMIKEACIRCKANKRKTVCPKDI